MGIRAVFHSEDLVYWPPDPDFGEHYGKRNAPEGEAGRGPENTVVAIQET
jgi:hypothetical protein